jgi:pimeloyl-ACP methyl ester carboxylesterase
MEPQLRDVTARGVRIRAAVAGEGPPLVLVHGYLQSRLSWEAATRELARSFRVVAPDLPGFGESERPPPERYAYGFDAFAESLVDLVAALELGRVALCGAGLGGAVALTLAAAHPHLVSRLVLVSPTLYPAREPLLVHVAGAPVVGGLVFKQAYGRALFGRHVRAHVYGGRGGDATMDAHYTHFNSPAARQAAHATLLATRDTRAVVARIPRVVAPTLVVWGRDDPVASIASGRRLARELAKATLEVLECGRAPHEEAPAALAGAVTSFLRAGA